MRECTFSLLALLLLKADICDVQQLPELKPLLGAAKGQHGIDIIQGVYQLANPMRTP